MTRGNGRQVIFPIEGDYHRMTDGFAKTVIRTSWQVLAYVWLPNHIHLFVRTPKPSLSRGMQYSLCEYVSHRHTTATLRELATVFGLSHLDSGRNLIRRAEIAISASKIQRQDLERIEELLQNQ